MEFWQLHMPHFKRLSGTFTIYIIRATIINLNILSNKTKQTHANKHTTVIFAKLRIQTGKSALTLRY